MGVLQDILYGVELQEVVGDTQQAVNGLCLDSRHVRAGYLFAALRGTQTDGHQFIDTAIGKGATAILCEELPAAVVEDVTYLIVPDAARALGIIADNFYDNPSAQLQLVAVTGTNGKTTVVSLLHQLFEQLGYKSGLLSTVRNIIHKTEIPATHTTPDAITIHRLLREMANAGCQYVFMEASSHAIHQNRIAGLHFAGAVFTNITHDHLDYHGTFDNYIKAKKALFDHLPATAWSLVNIDDKRGHVMVQNTKAKVYSFALKSPADYKARVLENAFTGLLLQLDGEELYSKLVGQFNAYNLLAVYGVARLLAADKIEILSQLSVIEPAEGRFDVLHGPHQVKAIVDYAHTPDALEKVLTTIGQIRTGNEQLIVVVGCGGDRDKEKRPKMAEVAAKLADKVILTADNPRSEDPESIIEEMRKGVLPPFNNKLLSITNRKEAIATAVALAQPGDIIVVAGKGHEKYQEIKGQRLPFDDKAILQNALHQNRP